MLRLTAVIVVVATIVHGCPSIKSRSDWHARSPTIRKDIGPNLPYVLIHHTETPQCNTQTACENRVRSIQNYHMSDRDWEDIGYNFLVDQFGTIYTGRGWNTHGAHSPEYNRRSIGIAVIGSYKTSNPSEKAITAVKDLIACGVTKGYIASDYKLLGHRQTRNTECPGDKFYSLIKTWPHWTENP